MPKFPHFSPTTASLSNQVFSELVRRARDHHGPLAPLHVGDTWKQPIPAAHCEAQRSSEHPQLHNYAPVRGEPALIEAFVHKVKARSQVELDPENVQVTSGATSGFSILATTLLDPGDEVILLSPFWPLIRGIIAARGAVPVELPFVELFDADSDRVQQALEALRTPRTVAVYVNTPHNPTGRFVSDGAAAGISAFARQHGLWVWSDEAYEDLWFGAEPPRPFWARPELRGHSVALHTVSKSYGMAGARIGFVHGPSDLMARVRGVQTFQTYCAPKPMQYAAAAAIRHGEQWLDEARRNYASAGQGAAALLGVAPPQGGTFLFFDTRPHWRAGEASALPFLERCLDAGVLLTPGAACGTAYADWARLCFTSVEPTALDAALQRLQTVLR